MKPFEYGDQEISYKEMLFAVPSMIVGVSILTLPRLVAEAVQSSDGWISILLAGSFACLFGWSMAKLASSYPRRTFYEYTTIITAKPIAFVFTIYLFLYFALFAGFVVRSIADISKQYLFDRTPVEVVALLFWLIVIYAVSGSRAGILRLNLLFFPLVLGIVSFLLIISIGIFEIKNLKPVFVSEWGGLLNGAKESIFSLLGFEVLLFYTSMANNPEKAPKAAVIGTIIPVVLYIAVYIIVIGIFSIEGAVHVVHPTIELAKEIHIPGEFFERFESLFFLIWIMTIFNTAAMSLDITIITLGSLWKRAKKMTLILIVSPSVYLISMMPQDTVQLSTLGTVISWSGLIFAGTVPFALLLIAKLRKGGARR